MAGHVDGFVLPIPKKNAAQFRRIASLAGKVWRDHGALAYFECVADDVKPGKTTSFPQAVNLKKGEAVWFSWIVFKSRAHRAPAVRRQAHDLRRLQSLGGGMTP